MSLPENFSVPGELMNRLYNTLLFYANRTSYEAPRIGGVLAGCPRGKEPTPDELTWNARWAIREIDRGLLPHNRPTDYWPIDADERNEFDALESKLTRCLNKLRAIGAADCTDFANRIEAESRVVKHGDARNG